MIYTDKEIIELFILFISATAFLSWFISKLWYKRKENQGDFAEELLREIKEERERRKKEGEEILERLTKEGVE